MGVRTALVAHPSADLYGADLQLLETVRALGQEGWRVVVGLPEAGPLTSRLVDAGAEIVLLPYPVLRKAQLRPHRLLATAFAALRAWPGLVRLVRRSRASVLLVNTLTLPWWVAAGRASGTPTVVHVHEAETAASRLVRAALLAPLRLADAVVVISLAVRQLVVDAQPALARRTQLVYNGVAGPVGQPVEPPVRPVRLLVVGRLSPRKAPHVALEAAARLVAAGHDVSLELAGTAFEGYESYADQLRARAALPDLAGRVRFSGYCCPVWSALERSRIVLAPSVQEPFGNAVVEAQLARRPVVAAAALGHLESVRDGTTGLLVAPGDADAMAAAVRRLLVEPDLARRLVDAAARSAAQRFAVDRYRREIAGLVAAVAAGRDTVRPTTGGPG